MPLFPAFLDLTDRAVLIVGEGPEADRKADKMRPFCAHILRSPYPPEWAEAPALVLLTQKDHPDNAFWAGHFRAQGIPVNVADRPELCDFRFPSLIVKNDLSIGIATDGKAPALASLLRQHIESALPEDLEAILTTAAALTAELRKTIPDQQERARILRDELQKLL